jgi:hypothetical protein
MIERPAAKLLVAGSPMAYHCFEKRKRRVSLDLGSLEEAELATLCSQCDKPEQQCSCEKYCCFCQSQQNVRLCVDGLYYCPDCREACDVRLAESDDR